MAQSNVGDQPIQLLAAGDGPKLIVNRDLVNQVMIGPDSGIWGGNLNDVSIIDPLGSVSVRGDKAVWCIQAPGSTANPTVDVIDALSWAPSPAQTAAQIGALGLMKDTTGQSINTNTTGAAKDSSVQTVATNTTGVAKDSSVQTVASNTSGVAKDSSVQTVATNTSGVAKDTSVQGISGQNWLTTGLAKDGSVLAQTASGLTIAQDVAGTGVPLLTKSSTMLSQTGVTLGAGLAVTYGPSAVTQIGYEFYIAANQTGGSTSNPFINITLTWTDSGTGRTVQVDNFWVAQGSGAQKISVGYGPTNGDQVSVTLTNKAGGTVTFDVTMAQNSRVYAREIWACMDTVAVPGNTNPGISPPGSGTLFAIGNASASATVGASSSLFRLLPLWTGKVRVYLNASGLSSNQCGFYFLTINSNPNGQCRLYQPTFLGNTNTDQTIEVTFPREPIQLQITNNNTSTANVQVTAVAEEY